jgi:hypothetical protein
VPDAEVMHTPTAASEPLKPGEGRVAEACGGGVLRGYTLGFHHLAGCVSGVVGGSQRTGGLLVLNWKDGEAKRVWKRRSFCVLGAWAMSWQGGLGLRDC